MLAAMKRYSLLLVFTLSLLLGLQLPHFLGNYESRLQGHYQEAQLQLAEFQSLADTYFNGDLQALIDKHQNSNVAVFRDEAIVIEKTYLRVQFLQQKIDNLQRPLWYRLGTLSQEVKQPIFIETWQHYQANIVLNQQAILVGITVAMLFTVLLELLGFSLKYGYCYCRKKSNTNVQAKH